MALRKSSYNYSDMVPETLRDFLFINSTDAEEFELFAVKTVYYRLNLYQSAYDDVFRDLLGSKDFLTPIELRAYVKIDEATTHGLTDTGADQTAERNGDIWFNISVLEHALGRVPVVGDVILYEQVHQHFEIFGISKEMFRLGRPVRYHCKVRLYQNISGPTTYSKEKIN